MTIMRRLLGLAITSIVLSPALAKSPVEPPLAGQRSKLPYALSDIAGLKHYTGPRAGLDHLRRRGLVITPEEKKHIFGFYESGQLPCFVTLDTAIHAYQVIFVDCFARFERRQVKVLAKLQGRMWDVLVAGELADKCKVTFPAQPRRGAATMALVARRLLEPDWKPKTPRGRELARSVAKAVAAELARIKAATLAKSPVFGRVVDYSQFTPRSFYAGDAELERYFRARTFWGQAMNLKDDAVLKTATMLVIVDSSIGDGREFRETYRQFVGPPAIIDARSMSTVLWLHLSSDEPDSLGFDVLHGKRLKDAREMLGDIDVPYHPTGATAGQVVDAHLEDALIASLLPKAAMGDSQIMARQIHPVVWGRGFPEGLDVLAALGNRRAESLLLASVTPGMRDDLAKAVKANKERLERAAEARDRGGLDGLAADVDPSPVVWDEWRKVFRSISDPDLGKQHPRFMGTDAYADKSINTALCGWVGYRHAFALHAEELGCIFSSEPGVPPGYVEPNLRAWDAMIDMTLALQEWLGWHDVPSGSLAGLTSMCLRARRIAARQLVGEKLTRRENIWLVNFGRTLAHLCGHDSNLLDAGGDDGVIADIAAARDIQQVLHVATARPRAIYAVFDYGGRLQLARGGVLHYREFTRPVADGRLTDQLWREMLKTGKAPPPPKWLADVGAAYDKKSIIAALKAGHVSPAGLLAVADKEVLLAAIEAARTGRPIGGRRRWPWPSPWPLPWGDGPVTSADAVCVLCDSHKELFDAEAVLALAAAAQDQQDTPGSSGELIEVLRCLSPKPSLAGTYIALADRWVVKKGRRKLGEAIVSSIVSCRTAKSDAWLTSQIIDGSGPYSTAAARELFATQPERMPTRLKRHFTAIERQAMAKYTAPGAKPATEEDIKALGEHIMRLAAMWPAWRPWRGRCGPAGTGAPEYTREQRECRDQAVAAAVSTIKLMPKDPDWPLLCAYARLLGPELLKTPLAAAVKRESIAMKWVTGKPDDGQ